MTIKVRIDGENNADLFWANLEEQMPILAQQLRDDSFTQLGETTIDEEQWKLVQEIEGFADGPAYARTALIRVEEFPDFSCPA